MRRCNPNSECHSKFWGSTGESLGVDQTERKKRHQSNKHQLITGDAKVAITSVSAPPPLRRLQSRLTAHKRSLSCAICHRVPTRAEWERWAGEEEKGREGEGRGMERPCDQTASQKLPFSFSPRVFLGVELGAAEPRAGVPAHQSGLACTWAAPKPNVQPSRTCERNAISWQK